MLLANILAISFLVVFSESLNLTSFRQARHASIDTCGVSSVSGVGLIYNGENFAKDTWPWMVAIMKRQAPIPKYICVGTLITRKQVVTAAHCVHQKFVNAPSNPRDVILVCGAYDLDEAFYSGTFSTSPTRIIVHDGWNPFAKSFDADIAMLVTEDDIPFTNSIRPICLWESSFDLNVNEGYIAGWGKSEKEDLNKIPKQLKIPIKKGIDCLLDNPLFTQIASKRTICGGSLNGAGPCIGDSGSGLFVKYQGAFFLRGIVSASLLNENKICDVTKFALYTDVLSFSSWIKDHSSKQVFHRSPPEAEKVCGQMTGSSSLIQGGFYASKEIFPWTVLIRDNQEEDKSSMHYSLTGTLVSNKHVVSSARFVSYYDDSGKLLLTDISSLQLFFGIRNVDYPSDAADTCSVSKIVLYPQYKGDGQDIDERNLAVLVASKRVEFSRVVQPICLWPQTDRQEEVLGKVGFAVGWGFDETLGVSAEKKYIRVIIEHENFCKSYYSKELESKKSAKFFCINTATKGVPCHGDSPFYIKSGEKWFLRGLFALSYIEEDSSCNPDNPTLYEDVAPMTNWIMSVIKTT